MPYAPGIQDISGQLIGEGMTRASNIRAQARSDFSKTIADTLVGGIQQYQQNENFNKQSLAKFTGMMQDPDFKQYVNSMLADENNTMGVPESVRTSLTNAQIGKLKSNDSAVLATIAQDFSEKKRANQEQDQKKAQTLLALAQGANQRAAADETNLKLQGMRSAQAELANIDTGNLSAVPSRPIVPQGIAQFGDVGSLASPQMAFDPRSNPIIAASLAQQQPTGRAISAIDSDQLNRQARRAQLEYQSSTGLLKPLDEFTTKILAVNKEARAAESANRADALAQRTSAAEMTFEQAFEKSKQLEKDNPNSIFTVKPGTSARSYVLEQSPRPIVPLDPRELALFNSENKIASEALAGIAEAARIASDDLPRTERILQALDKDSTTGTLAPLSIAAKKVFSGSGLVDEVKLSRNEVLSSDLGLDALQKARTLLKGQGAVSEPERVRIDKVATDIRKEKGSIKELTQITRAVSQRSIAADEYRSSLYENMDVNDTNRLIKLNRSMDKWFRENKLPKFGYPVDLKPEPTMFADEIKEKLRRNAK